MIRTPQSHWTVGIVLEDLSNSVPWIEILAEVRRQRKSHNVEERESADTIEDLLDPLRGRLAAL